MSNIFDEKRLGLKPVDSIEDLAKKGLITEKCKNEIKKLFKEELKNLEVIEAELDKDNLPKSITMLQAQEWLIYQFMPSFKKEKI